MAPRVFVFINRYFPVTLAGNLPMLSIDKLLLNTDLAQ